MPELTQEHETPVQTPAVSPKKVSRRNMLLTLGIALNAVAGALFAVPVVGYVFGPARRKEMKKELAWITLGPMTQFPEGETRLATYRNPFVRPWDGDTGNIPCWVRRISSDKLQVFAINCAHLGCPVRWYAQSGLFLCPCHGGAYYADGSRASGPPPRGLFEYDYKIEGGELWIKAGQVPTLASPPSQACNNQPRRCACA
jgi:Rieske Fe-S protein